MRLFNDIERTDSSPGRYTEPTPAFLNRVDSDHFAAACELLEEWFEATPPDLQPDIRGRFWAKGQYSWHSPFWELYLAAAFRHLGFEIAYHPDVPDATFHPDFLLTRGSERLYVEAKVAGFSPAETASEMRLNVVLDAVNELDSPDFFLHVQVERIGSTSAPVRKLLNGLRRWLSTLDWDALSLESQRMTSLDQLARYTWRPEGLDWELHFQAVPKLKFRGRPGVHTIGGQGHPAQFIDDRTPVRKAIGQKATRYGAVGAPLVVALMCSRTFASETDVDDALFGSEAVQVAFRDGRAGDARLVRQLDGVWLGPRGPYNTRVSAILVAIHLHPSSIAQTQLRLWLNPWAQFPLDVALPWPRRVIDPASHQLVSADGEMPSHEILGLPSDWPGPGDHFAKWHEISRTPST
ncbi:MAG: hypothetical protein DCC49_09335 [Acidobacteria bacterium]|nr:MAG: hypothetical protein DCC49_09335 [Acidobacteriota bacterium]